MTRNTAFSRLSPVLLTGDTVTLAVVTIFGFATHGEAATAGLRMATTFLPLLVAWLLAAAPLDLLSPQAARRRPSLLRLLWAGLLAAPLAAWLRALWLGHAVVPIFVAVLGGVGAPALVAWRYLWWWWRARRK